MLLKRENYESKAKREQDKEGVRQRESKIKRE